MVRPPVDAMPEVTIRKMLLLEWLEASCLIRASVTTDKILLSEDFERVRMECFIEDGASASGAIKDAMEAGKACLATGSDRA